MKANVSRSIRLVGFVSDRSHLLYFLAVVTLLVVAFVVRTIGNSFGLPALFHPDEPAIAEHAVDILRTGDFNPRWFNYPSLYIYVQAAADVFVFLSSMGNQVDNITLPTLPDFEYMRFGRTITAIFGTLTALTVYYAGRTLFSARVGLFATALLTFSLLHTINSHYITTDVPMTFFASLSFLASALVLRTGKGRYYLLAGLTAGLAASTKYNGSIALISLLAAHWVVAWRQRSAFNFWIVAAMAALTVGFFAGTPYALLDLPGFLRTFAFEIAHYRSGQATFEGGNNILWYLGTILGGWDSILLIFALAGAVTSLIRGRASYYLLLVFPIAYIWWFNSFVVRFERNLVPLIPFMALLAAVFIDGPLSSLAAKWLRFRPFALVQVCLLALAVIPSLIGIIEFDSLLSKKHAKTIAAEWGNSNLPSGAKIAVESYGIPLNRKTFELVNVVAVADHTVEWFFQQRFDYVVVSDGVWSRYYMQPAKYSKEVAAYDAIFNKLKPEKAVELPATSNRLASYPTVGVYHLPQVRIYKVEEKAE